jgi:hypothetical protein
MTLSVRCQTPTFIEHFGHQLVFLKFAIIQDVVWIDFSVSNFNYTIWDSLNPYFKRVL